jgi:DNA repair exonuclease SbcCD ATPase subunit
MGGLLSKKKPYEKLDEYAIKYAGFDEHNCDDNNFGLVESKTNEITNIRQDIHNCFNQINNKLSFFNEKTLELEKDLIIKDNLIKKLQNENQSIEIHFNALNKLLEQRFNIYDKDLDSLLKNDKIILKKIEELHPEIKNTSKSIASIDIIKNSFLESNIEYSSFINE